MNIHPISNTQYGNILIRDSFHPAPCRGAKGAWAGLGPPAEGPGGGRPHREGRRRGAWGRLRGL